MAVFLLGIGILIKTNNNVVVCVVAVVDVVVVVSFETRCDYLTSSSQPYNILDKLLLKQKKR